jgi:hypothetical protein
MRCSEFVAREPNNRAGVYAEHSVWRFENLLGRTMWEFPGAADEPKFLIIAHSHGSPGDRSERPAVATGSLSTELRKQLIVHGALRTLDDAALVGFALAVQAGTGKRSTHSSIRGERDSRPSRVSRSTTGSSGADADPATAPDEMTAPHGPASGMSPVTPMRVNRYLSCRFLM